jgi:hypothetical protein
MARAGFNINSFLAVMAENGIQRNNKYLVRFPTPNSLLGASNISSGAYINTSRELEYFCDSALIPGVAMLTHPTLRYGYGTTNKMPFAVQFNDASFTFIGDGSAAIWTLMTQWMNSTIGFSLIDGFPSKEYELSYRGSYTSDINVIAFNDAGDVTFDIVMREAFPVYVGDMPLNWSDNNSIQRIPVTFSFNDWYNNALTPVTPIP